MDRSELRREVQESLEEGYSLEEIQKAMIEDGYSPGFVHDLLSEFQNSVQTENKLKESVQQEEGIEGDSNKGVESRNTPGSEDENSDAEPLDKIKGKRRSPARVVLFSLVTFGIYFFYWEYLMMKYALTTRMERGKARFAALGLWFVTAIPLVNLAIWAYFFREIIKAAPVEKEPNKYTAIYVVVIFTGIGIFFTQYMVQKDVNSGLEK